MHDRLRRVWPRVRLAVYGVFFALTLVAVLANSARLPFAHHLKVVALAFAVPFVAFGVIEEILERRGLIDKTRKSDAWDEAPPPRPAPDLSPWPRNRMSTPSRKPRPKR